jgi:hypothetical protein
MLIFFSTDERLLIQNFTDPLIKGEAVCIHAMEIQEEWEYTGRCRMKVSLLGDDNIGHCEQNFL